MRRARNSKQLWYEQGKNMNCVFLGQFAFITIHPQSTMNFVRSSFVLLPFFELALIGLIASILNKLASLKTC